MKKSLSKLIKVLLISLIPFILCSILAGLYYTIQPQDYPHLSYPYKTPGALHYLATRWFIIGIVLSILFFLIMVFEDIFTYLDKAIERRQLKKKGLL
jgi:hypothetical protein